MSVALVLSAYAIALAVVAPRVLVRSWVDRAPRMAIAVWQAVTGSVLVSVILGATALTFSTVRISANLAALLKECVMALRDHYASPGGAMLAAIGAVVALGMIGRVAWCFVVALVRAGVRRRRMRDTLAILGRTDVGSPFVVIDHRSPAAYCIPGARRRIVLTTGALEALDDDQLRAVLAHERAHLRGRHDLVLAGSMALANAFGGVQLFRLAHIEMTRLVELLADDAATRGTDRLTVAEALLALGSGGPAGTLAAGGSPTGARVRRLITGYRPLGRVRTAVGSFSAAALLTLPVLVLSVPALLAWGSPYCPTQSAATTSAASSAARSGTDCPIETCAFQGR